MGDTTPCWCHVLSWSRPRRRGSVDVPDAETWPTAPPAAFKRLARLDVLLIDEVPKPYIRIVE
jgi:hypothetical protein